MAKHSPQHRQHKILKPFKAALRERGISYSTGRAAHFRGELPTRRSERQSVTERGTSRTPMLTHGSSETLTPDTWRREQRRHAVGASPATDRSSRRYQALIRGCVPVACSRSGRLDRIRRIADHRVGCWRSSGAGRWTSTCSRRARMRSNLWSLTTEYLTA
jgi:hypothetical protein